MSTGSSEAAVSRLVFNRALLVTWMYIMLLATNLASKSRGWADYLLVLGALIMMVAFCVALFRGTRARV